MTIKNLAIISLLLVSTVGSAKQIVVAVIDTGISSYYKNKKFLCKEGHKDFTGTGLNDTHGHGTHISGLIHQEVMNLHILYQPDISSVINSVDPNYCQLIIKFYDSGSNSINSEINAVNYAIEKKVDIINISAGGFDIDSLEKAAIKRALDAGIIIVAAAGNEGVSLEKRPYYPASYDSRIIVVGSLISANKRSKFSNYSTKVNSWEIGTNLISFGIDGKAKSMSGTSQATAVKSGKIVRKMLHLGHY